VIEVNYYDLAIWEFGMGEALGEDMGIQLGVG
jgi:hypothetical protein